MHANADAATHMFEFNGDLEFQTLTVDRIQNGLPEQCEEPLASHGGVKELLCGVQCATHAEILYRSHDFVPAEADLMPHKHVNSKLTLFADEMFKSNEIERKQITQSTPYKVRPR